MIIYRIYMIILNPLACSVRFPKWIVVRIRGSYYIDGLLNRCFMPSWNSPSYLSGLEIMHWFEHPSI